MSAVFSLCIRVDRDIDPYFRKDQDPETKENISSVFRPISGSCSATQDKSRVGSRESGPACTNHDRTRYPVPGTIRMPKNRPVQHISRTGSCIRCSGFGTVRVPGTLTRYQYPYQVAPNRERDRSASALALRGTLSHPLCCVRPSDLPNGLTLLFLLGNSSARKRPGGPGRLLSVRPRGRTPDACSQLCCPRLFGAAVRSRPRRESPGAAARGSIGRQERGLAASCCHVRDPGPGGRAGGAAIPPGWTRGRRRT